MVGRDNGAINRAVFVIETFIGAIMRSGIDDEPWSLTIPIE